MGGATASSGLPVLVMSYSSCVKNSQSHTDPQIRTVMETSLISPWEYLLYFFLKFLKLLFIVNWCVEVRGQLHEIGSFFLYIGSHRWMVFWFALCWDTTLIRTTLGRRGFIWLTGYIVQWGKPGPELKAGTEAESRRRRRNAACWPVQPLYLSTQAHLSRLPLPTVG